MALVLRVENNGATNTFDLTAVVKRSSHQQQRAGNRVIETWTLLKKGAAADIRAAINALIDLLEQAIEWHRDPTKDDSVWLREVTDGETAKRALIYNYELLPVTGSGKSPYLINPGAAWQLAITRHVAWEDTTATTPTGATGVSCNGGTWDLSATSGGSLDGRISDFTINETTASVELTEGWAGILPDNGYLSSFTPEGKLQYATPGTDTVQAAETGSSGTTVLKTTFVDASLINRGYVSLFSLFGSPGYLAYTGRFVILLRCKVGGTSTSVAARLVMNFDAALFATPSGASFPGQIQYGLDHTSWKLINMGEFQIPPEPYRQASKISTKGLSLGLEAEKLDGTSSIFYADTLIFIPAKHYFSWSNSTIEQNFRGHVYTYEDDAVFGYTVGSGFLAKPRLDIHDWRYPKEGGKLALAFQRDAGHGLTDAVDLDVEIFKRWKSYHD
jgi:hypothetical protein